ncbi:MAG: hypothetical protein KGI50_01565 [Patescibacteria group bacterium]|nr:hypothetical protein [Patescibacteria group bacterium]MDE2437969.1 hypothetical protein [Patescibacteria group bacterium]
MVEKFKKILEKMETAKGGVFLFALMKMDELTDKWTVVLCAPWAKEGDAEIFKYVLNLIQSEFSQEELSTIARIGLFSKTDHLIGELMKYNSDTSISNEKVNGNQVHYGYIIKSNPSMKENFVEGAKTGNF